jgi:hypothetical protein
MRILRPVFLAALLLSGAALHAQTADEVVQKYLNAIGGEAAWKEVKTMTATGSSRSAGPDVTLTMTAIHMEGFRSEYTTVGTTGYTIVTPAAGWYFNPGTGQTTAATMTPEQVRLSQAQLDIQGELVDYKAKGHTVEYGGEAKVDGKSCYLLRVVTKAGTREEMYIDKSTHYLIRTVTRTMVDGEESEDIAGYGNYTPQQGGLIYPMKLSTAGGDIVLTRVVFNEPVNPKVFTPGG